MRITNIYNDRRKIYLFIREGNELKIETDESFFPCYYEPDPKGECKAYTGESLRKIYVSNPGDVAKNRTTNAWEADIIFTRRYAIDKIDKIDKANIKYTFIDIETKADELPNVKEAKYPISYISAYNSYTKEVKQFCLPDYETEFQMMEDFITYIKTERFDLLTGWNFTGFDYPYMYNRFPDFAEKISIIGKSRYGKEDILYPAGVSIVDYYEWDKKITLNRRKSYKLDDVIKEEFGIERSKKYNFNEFSEEIKTKNREDVEFLAKLEDKKHYIPYYDEVRRLSKVEWEDLIWNSRILDLLLLQEAKNQKVTLPMKPAEDRGTLEEKADYQGAYRDVFQTGAHFDVTKYDLGSAYPQAIIDFCLDPANVCYVPLNTPTKEGDLRIGESVFRQNSNTLLPTVVKKLIILKTEIKKKLSALGLNSPEHKDMKKKYDAIKSIVNSAYGVFGNRFFRLYNKEVAAATTFIIRSLLHYVQDKLEARGHKVIYVDTDSVFLNTSENLNSLLNDLVQQWGKETFGKDKINIEFGYEGIFTKLLLLTKCRYLGYVKTDQGIEEEMKGIEAKRKDSTEFMKKFQRTLIDKILNKESQEIVVNWVKTQTEEIKNASVQDIAFPCKLGRKVEDYKNRPIFVRALDYTKEVCEFNKKVGSPFYYVYVKPDGYEDNEKEQNLIMTYDKDYNEKGFKNVTEKRIDKACKFNFGKDFVVSYDNSQNIDNTIEKKLREKKLYKTETVKTKGKAKDVLAFDEDTFNHIDKDKIDWDRIIGRNITNKTEVIFEAMGWTKEV